MPRPDPDETRITTTSLTASPARGDPDSSAANGGSMRGQRFAALATHWAGGFQGPTAKMSLMQMAPDGRRPSEDPEEEKESRAGACHTDGNVTDVPPLTESLATHLWYLSANKVSPDHHVRYPTPDAFQLTRRDTYVLLPTFQFSPRVLHHDQSGRFFVSISWMQIVICIHEMLTMKLNVSFQVIYTLRGTSVYDKKIRMVD